MGKMGMRKCIFANRRRVLSPKFHLCPTKLSDTTTGKDASTMSDVFVHLQQLVVEKELGHRGKFRSTGYVIRQLPTQIIYAVRLRTDVEPRRTALNGYVCTLPIPH
eukprot:scaffold133_cov115-Cylindrotheca_fusiformis.AAC.6